MQTPRSMGASLLVLVCAAALAQEDSGYTQVRPPSAEHSQVAWL